MYWEKVPHTVPLRGHVAIHCQPSGRPPSPWDAYSTPLLSRRFRAQSKDRQPPLVLSPQETLRSLYPQPLIGTASAAHVAIPPNTPQMPRWPKRWAAPGTVPGHVTRCSLPLTGTLTPLSPAHPPMNGKALGKAELPVPQGLPHTCRSNLCVPGGLGHCCTGRRVSF